MGVTKLAEGIYNVGVSDWNIRDFHGYSTHRGSTYNAFLILDDRIALVDTVKKAFADELLQNISQIVDPKKIDCVISNHTEMDHSGALPSVMHKIGEDKPLYVSKMGKKNHGLHFTQNWNYQIVENLSTLNLGKRSLTFLETRMLHWPDSMFTYVNEDKILFSSDAFGQHYAGPEEFDDQIGDAIIPHAKKYFANDRVIRDTGKEKPKKKTSSLSLGSWIKFRYSLFKITQLETISPMDRQSREDCWNLRYTGSFLLKISRGNRAKCLMRTDSTIAAKTRESNMAGIYIFKKARRA